MIYALKKFLDTNYNVIFFNLFNIKYIFFLNILKLKGNSVKKISIVTPVFNESENIEVFLKKIKAIMLANSLN